MTIEELDAAGNVKGKVALDFLIHLVKVEVCGDGIDNDGDGQIDEDCNPPIFNNPPTTPACGSTVSVSLGSTLTFSIQSSDPDAGQIVTLNVVGLPAGATMTPPLPTSGNPVSSTFSWTPTAAQVGTHVITFTAADNSGGGAGIQGQCSIIVRTDNVPPTIAADNASVAVNEGQTASNTGTYSDANAGDNVTISASVGTVTKTGTNSGTWSWSFATTDGPTLSQTVTMTANDGKGGVATTTFALTVNNLPPGVSITQPVMGTLLAVNTTVNLSASLSDPGIGDTHTCAINWDDGTTTAGIVTEANGAGTCAGSRAFPTAGVYTIEVKVMDDDGGTGTATVLVVVYDPSAGFVTGGGWIDSPAGAYTANPSLSGRANFGFVSKYHKGATTPTGQTEFQFQVASLNFHSDLYEWLVVSGAMAQYKGTGTVNGVGGYAFLLTVTDGQQPGGNGVDKFRIKIWNVGGVVYDNVLGRSDDMNAANPQAIAGGSIVIHK